MSKYYPLTHKLADLSDLKAKGIERGVEVGIASLSEYFRLRKGFPLFIAGAPYSGKTEFTFEILINTSILYGWRHFIYCGEGGNVENIYAELMAKFIGKPFDNSPYGMNSDEELKAQIFISKHFVVANHDMEFTVNEFYQMVDEAESEFGKKFDTTTFDPFNDVKEEIEFHGGREDKYLASVLKYVRVNAKINDRINI